MIDPFCCPPCAYLVSHIASVNIAVSVSTQRHCVANHFTREILKTKRYKSRFFVPNRHLSLTIINVAFHQLSLAEYITFCPLDHLFLFLVCHRHIVCDGRATGAYTWPQKSIPIKTRMNYDLL